MESELVTSKEETHLLHHLGFIGPGGAGTCGDDRIPSRACHWPVILRHGDKVERFRRITFRVNFIDHRSGDIRHVGLDIEDERGGIQGRDLPPQVLDMLDDQVGQDFEILGIDDIRSNELEHFIILQWIQSGLYS